MWNPPDPPLPKRSPKLLLILPALLMTTLVLMYWRGMSVDPNTLPSPSLGKPMPAFSLPDLADPAHLLTETDLQGPAILNVWASWCIACREENPYLLELSHEGYRIYGVDYLDRNEDALAWLAREGDPFGKVIVDAEGKLGQTLGLIGAPETYAIDAQGIVVFRHVGALAPKVIENLKATIARK
ncbi:MAG: DsbE family thiol:disulfide interchange protein [Methylococcaceae bacterium]|nr:DsbE family thiol:disulfide interchange protein [Methylococcaceae bacterium]